MVRLCFGVFGQVLRDCKLKNVTDRMLIGTMTRTVDPNCQYINSENATAVSRLLSCVGNLSNGRMKNHGSKAIKKPGESISNVVNAALKADRDLVTQKFRESVLCLLDEDKKELAVLSLLDVIRKDSSLDEEKKLSFEKYVGKTKNALLVQDEIVLDIFLSGIFLYTIAAGVVNTIGKDTLKVLTFDYYNNLKNSRGIKIIDSKFEAVFDSTFAASPVDIQIDTAEVNERPICDYLHNAKSKFVFIKTLLYHDQPKQFYDFFVCNDIERVIPKAGKFGTSFESSILENVTCRTLSECSHFVIIAGTGGLGKSMMMRHLLLNSISNYNELRIMPIFIPLKDYDGSQSNLFNYIYSKVISLSEGITEEILEEALKTGKCLLLFDALDEIGSHYAQGFEKELERFTDLYPDNQFVISSRPYQSFISFSRFTVLKLKPFSKNQAVQLIEKLEFRPDEPMIKEKFITKLKDSLFITHREFIENPLLLTIMLLTFEQFAEVPSKMHLFYKEAFSALSVRHDASKGAYKRSFKTGFTVEKLTDYFAEFCSRSYHDEKFELSEDEIASYFATIVDRENSTLMVTTVGDFLYDLCSNMCLMYYESGKYHFTHRSFQEYFCALFFSRQKDKNLKIIGDFFENRQRRNMFGDKTFSMLYDMIPEKVEEYIFLPFLTDLLAQCEKKGGYWTFLEMMYPTLMYENGETNSFVLNTPQSFLLMSILEIFHSWLVIFKDFPHYEDLVTEEYVRVMEEDGSPKIVNSEESLGYILEYGDLEVVGWVYEFEVEKISLEPDKYVELLDRLDECKFVLKENYALIREYKRKLEIKQKSSGSNLFDWF